MEIHSKGQDIVFFLWRLAFLCEEEIESRQSVISMSIRHGGNRAHLHNERMVLFYETKPTSPNQYVKLMSDTD